ncbi:hypothetical protein F4678DRAFT_486728 [Xylaria arbuscula]|nr:hypothetical protein F4678DRAFT_486728 [Xylaria arbuscula]
MAWLSLRPSRLKGTYRRHLGRNCNLDGSNIQDVIPRGAAHTPKQLHIDPDGSKIYFSDRKGLRVMRCNLDGSDLEIIVQTGDWKIAEHQSDQTRWCVGVAVSPTSGKFYWTQKGNSKGSQGRIFRASIEPQAGERAISRSDIECLFQGLPEPIDLDVDEESNYLYWTDRGELQLGNSINRASLDKIQTVKDQTFRSMPCKDYEIISRNLHETIGLSLDLKNKHIYATDLGGLVYRCDLDGQNRKTVYGEDSAFTGIAHLFV